MKNQFYLIPIIAILAGMLLPALNKARQKAYDIKCVNTQKQIGMWFTTYASDYKEWSIGHYYESAGGPSKIAWMHFFWKGDAYDVGISTKDASALMKFLTCDTMAGKTNSVAKSSGSGAGYLGYYVVNKYLSDVRDRGSYGWAIANGFMFFKPSTVKLPNRLFWTKCGNLYSDDTYRFVHGNSAQLLFVDMTVKRMDMRDLYDPSNHNVNWQRYPASGSPKKTGF